MQCSYIIFALLFSVANSTFWYKNDFERVMGAYKKDLSQDYLRALSIFKRKLQLLGFYPIVSNDDGLEYVSLDPYLIEDDYDDEMYELLKKMKKEKKARRKLLKKKLKKSKKTKPTVTPPTTIQPISNIVYYWPSAITTIIQPGDGHNTYEHSIDTAISSSENIEKKQYDDDSSEENSFEVDDSSKTPSISNNKSNQSKVQKPAKINYETSFSSERKLTLFEEDENHSYIRAVQNETSNSSTSTTSTTTPYPLLTVFPDPDEVAIQEILDQQEIINKITHNEQGNVTEVNAKDHDILTAETIANVEDNLKELETVFQVAIELPSGGDMDDLSDISQTLPEDTKNEDKNLEEILPSQSTELEIISTVTIDTTQSSSGSFEAATPDAIPAGVLEFFHETFPEPDDNYSSIVSPSTSEVVDNIPISEPHEQVDISNEISETTENDNANGGHPEIHSEPNNSIVQMNKETTVASDITQYIDEHLPTVNPLVDSLKNDDTVYVDFDVRLQTDNITDQPERYEYSTDPKIKLSIEIDDDFGSRSLIDDPTAATVDDKSGRRSDVPIEAEDINDEDTTDDLPYNLTADNLLQQSSIIENTSAETSTPPSATDVVDFDNFDQFDEEIIPLIPIIIKQMKQGNVSPEEMEILKNTFGQFWPFIVEEASRESDSSEEMNPLLSEVLNAVNRRVVKREATIGTWRRPIYGRRIYFDDEDDFVPRRRHYGRRRRPVVGYYYT